MDNLKIIEYANIHSQVNDLETAHLVIGLDKVLASRTVKGLIVKTNQIADGVKIDITVQKDTIIQKPVHMCFGLMQEIGIQKINLSINVEANAQISVMAHCVFPNAADVKHIMDAEINIAENAKYTYYERHIHSPQGGIEVIPKAKIKVASHGYFKTDFELLEGRVGSIDIDYETYCADYAVMEMNAKISGKGTDSINIKETGYLQGEYSRGLLTSRVAVRDNAQAEICSKLIAQGPYARGHVDCKEIMQGNGWVSAIPIVEVHNKKAHITHEAALGSVDSKQLQTLMSRGLTEEEASDLIVSGLLS